MRLLLRDMSAQLEVVEDGEEHSTTLPLVLIHDGGGTIFQYYLLGPFSRQVFGISSPYFESGSKPPDGVPQLAKEYAHAIEAEIGHGDIVLGGEPAYPFVRECESHCG
jgi:hypothetical protein